MARSLRERFRKAKCRKRPSAFAVTRKKTNGLGAMVRSKINKFSGCDRWYHPSCIGMNEREFKVE